MYLYNARNTVMEEKVKEKLSESERSAVESTVKGGLDWLENNREASAEEVKGKQKEWEEAIRPTLMRLYAAEAGKTDPAEPAGTQPVVEEID